MGVPLWVGHFGKVTVGGGLWESSESDIRVERCTDLER